MVKAMVFPVVMYGCESWTIKKAEHRRSDAFELWCWRRILRVPWTAGRSNQSILKEISPGCSLEGLMMGWNSNSSTLATWCKELTHLKRPWFWERLRAGEEGDNRGWDGWMASLTWWTWVGGTPGVGDGQGSLASCGSWGGKESDTTEWLNLTKTPSMTPSVGWRGPLKKVKSEDTAAVSIRNETLCPATMPKLPVCLYVAYLGSGASASSLE